MAGKGCTVAETYLSHAIEAASLSGAEYDTNATSEKETFQTCIRKFMHKPVEAVKGATFKSKKAPHNVYKK